MSKTQFVWVPMVTLCFLAPLAASLCHPTCDDSFKIETFIVATAIQGHLYLCVKPPAESTYHNSEK